MNLLKENNYYIKIQMFKRYINMFWELSIEVYKKVLMASSQNTKLCIN